MSAKPEDKDKEQRKEGQTTPLEINMAPALGEKEKETAKKDTAEEISIEESNSNSNSPIEKRSSADPQQRHSTSVAAPAPTPTAVPNHVSAPTAVAVDVAPLVPAPIPLWKGITGMISNTVSKVWFGAPREAFGSESDTGEASLLPSKPLPAPAPALAGVPPSTNVTEVDSQDEKRELKRTRHEAARAYALGLGEDEKAYDTSTVAVPKVPDQKPKRKVFNSPRPSQPQTDAERHHAARAFALSVPPLPLSRKRRRDKEESSNDAHANKHPRSRRRTSKGTAWEDRLSELANYRKVHGHCNVPQKCSENAKLGTWVAMQRSQYRLHLKGKTSQITISRLLALKGLGFEWGSRATAFEDRLSELADYRKVHGHCNVPKNYTGNTKLYAWVGKQRYQYSLHLKGKTSSISLPRIQALERLGFEWKPSSSRRRGKTKKTNLGAAAPPVRGRTV
jgi:hypothetical protein